MQLHARSTSAKVEKMAYTREDLKEILSVSILTIYRLERKGMLPRIKGLRRPLYSRESVEAFITGKN